MNSVVTPSRRSVSSRSGGLATGAVDAPKRNGNSTAAPSPNVNASGGVPLNTSSGCGSRIVARERVARREQVAVEVHAALRHAGRARREGDDRDVVGGGVDGLERAGRRQLLEHAHVQRLRPRRPGRPRRSRATPAPSRPPSRSRPRAAAASSPRRSRPRAGSRATRRSSPPCSARAAARASPARSPARPRSPRRARAARRSSSRPRSPSPRGRAARPPRSPAPARRAAAGPATGRVAAGGRARTCPSVPPRLDELLRQQRRVREHHLVAAGHLHEPAQPEPGREPRVPAPLRPAAARCPRCS